jgi:hypothetical protein
LNLTDCGERLREGVDYLALNASLFNYRKKNRNGDIDDLEWFSSNNCRVRWSVG